MDPLAALALLNGLLGLTEQLLPVIDDFKKKGLITDEQQAEVLAKYNSLKNKADGQFSGPAWKVQ